MKKTLKELFYDKKCAGWAVPVGDKYAWQNANDLGLINSVEDCDEKFKVLEQIIIAPEHYIAVLENKDEIGEEQLGLGAASTKKEMIACIKDCFGLAMTPEEKKLSDNYYKF